jgi:hypothetical protein
MLTQTAGTDDTIFCFAQGPSKRLAAQGWFLIGNLPFGRRFLSPFIHPTL